MINVFIADDHQMIIDGLKSLLEGEENIQVVGEALNGKGVIEFLKNNTCQLILLDINMPEMDGLATTAEVKKNFPEVKILILSMHNTRDFVESVMQAGAEGYILKNAGRDELLAAINTIHKGSYFYGNAIMESLLNGAKAANDKKDIQQLSRRELEIIRLIADGLTTQEIADKLFISPHTVDTHRKNLLAKLNVRNTAGLVKYAIHNRLD